MSDIDAKVAEINERLESLIEQDADSRAQLRADITEVYDQADADDPVVDTMITAMNHLNNFEQLLERLEAVETAAKEKEEAEAKAKAEADEKAKAEAEKVEAEPENKKTEEVEEDAKAETKTEAATTDEATATSEAEKGSEVAMAASAAQVPEDNRPIQRPAVTTRPVIGQDLGLTAGADFRDRDELNEAFARKIEQIRTGAGGGGEKHSVVTLMASIAAERQLGLSDSTANQKKIDAVMAPTAIVASGGYCAPLPVNYDIFGVGSSARPVRDALPTFGATRGGIRYIAPPLLGAYNDAISLWTAANDVNPTNPTVKPTLKVNCASELTATADAVTLSLEFGNLMTRAFPELVQRHNQLALIQHARFAERTLLNKISAASTKVTTSWNQGATRDLLLAITKASAAYRNRHRIPRPIRLRAIMPEWTRDLLREDIASNLAIENLAVDDAVLDSWFAKRGLSISWHIDDTFENQGNDAPLKDLPGKIKFWLFAEGTFLFLDGGTLDLGVIRDSDLVGTNDYMTFVETFEGIAKVGIESLEVEATTGISPAVGS
ncbi:major capsid hexamer protein [Gordonia phage Forza]|uniref:Major capsid protein n=1 Tax=Gordonia phage Forza TaxID=2571247 RepID=A0A650EYF3_9CAUD|nr:major head protein [Gordonia phage Forza]QEM41554.1 major capsid hexamer protein [Gordonia phage Boopy]QGT55080.1 major capsid hexamer protein [Gordonia phage Forza]UXE04228.1 major capsid hexamer protein [Gordonia phage BlueNGold]WBF03868.1 major capsid hexamer protein [Gordonia phage Mareelih]